VCVEGGGWVVNSIGKKIKIEVVSRICDDELNSLLHARLSTISTTIHKGIIYSYELNRRQGNCEATGKRGT
jgi:hypothetical protein